MFVSIAHPTILLMSGIVLCKCSSNVLIGYVICSDRILTCRIKSIRSPAKVGLVVIDLITSPVVSWRGWRHPPPPPAPWLSCHSLLNHRRVKTSLSCGDLLLSSARLLFTFGGCLNGILFSSAKYFPFFLSFSLANYVERIKDLSRCGGQEVWCLPGKIRSRSPPHLY